MTNIDDFKSFVKENPKLVNFVNNKTMSWQDFYELYDLYGKDNIVWDKYLKNDNTREVSSKNSSLSNVMNMAKNMDVNKLQDGIDSIQKAISLFGDILIKKDDTTSGYTPRPIYRKFDD